MKYLLIAIGLIFPLAGSAEIYKSVDADGNVVFSDKPSPDAEKIDIKEIQTIESQPYKPFEYTPPAEPAVSGYSKLDITTPLNNSEVRENSGNISVIVNIEPELNVGAGDKLLLYLDGSKLQEGTSTQFQLTNIDRGTHTVSVTAVDASGNKITRSSDVIFTLLRYSALQPNAPPPPPPSGFNR